MNEPALELRHFGLASPDGPILEGLSLAVAAGEIVGLAGPSGAGKSLLAAAVAGRLPATVRQTGTLAVRAGRVGWAMQDATDALDPLRRIESELRATLRAHRRAADPAPWLRAVGLTAAEGARRASCPADNASARSWLWPCARGRTCWWPTSPPRRSTPPRASVSAICCVGPRVRAAPPFC